MAAGKTFADAARMALEIGVEESWPGSRPRARK